MDLLLHPQTNDQINAFLDKPSHSLLLEGSLGSGKAALARYVSAKLINSTEENIENNSFYLHIAPTTRTIPIAAIRDAQQFMRLKTIGNQSIRRVLLVEDAQYLTIEAQNAFLKLLEEPPADTVIILTATANHSLLPTIYSRLQTIRIKTPNKQSIEQYFQKQGFILTDINRAYYISEGNIGLMHALLIDNKEHTLVSRIDEAKILLNKSPFDRLAVVDALSKQKEQLPELLYALQRICHAVLLQASDQDNTAQVKKSHHALKQIISAEGMLKHNPNAKLLLTDLLLNI